MFVSPSEADVHCLGQRGRWESLRTHSLQFLGPHLTKGTTLLLRHHHLPLLILHHISPGHFRIVGKHGQPLLRHGLCVITLAAFDSLERIQVVGHHPVQIKMRAGRNQVGDVTRRLSAALHQDRLHVARVSGIDADRYAGNNFRVAAQQRHLSAFDQRIVILRDVADPVALIFVGVFPLAFLHVVLCLGESGGNLVALADGVPSAMIEVQMAVDDNVDIVRRDARLGELVEQFSGLAVDLDHSVRRACCPHRFRSARFCDPVRTTTEFNPNGTRLLPLWLLPCVPTGFWGRRRTCLRHRGGRSRRR